MRFARLIESLVGGVEQPLDCRHVTGYVLTCDLRDDIQRSLYYTGTFEPRTTALIRSELAEGDVFLDVGANVGHFTLVGAAAVGLAGRVHAVEASSTTASKLRTAIERNGLADVVSVHALAAADSAYTASLKAATATSDPLGLRHIRPSGSGTLLETVCALPLDAVLPDIHPAVIKVDVEGAELRALMGMRGILRRAKPRLVVTEAQDELLAAFGDSVLSIDQYMADLDYVAQDFCEPGHAPSRAYRLRTNLLP